MGIRVEEFAVTCDASGAGTATSAAPIAGEVLRVRLGGTAFGGTADFTLVEVKHGGTVLNLSNPGTVFDYAPRQQTSDNSGSALSAYEPYPVQDYLRLTIAQAEASAAGTVYVYYSKPRPL